MDRELLNWVIKDMSKNPRDSECFNLTNMSLTEIPESVFGNKELQLLNLSENKITSLPDMFDELPNLRVLNLSYNCLREIPPSVTRLKKLVQLNIRNNQLESLPDNIFYYPTKNNENTNIILDNNNLTTLRKVKIFSGVYRDFSGYISANDNPLKDINNPIFERYPLRLNNPPMDTNYFYWMNTNKWGIGFMFQLGMNTFLLPRKDSKLLGKPDNGTYWFGTNNYRSRDVLWHQIESYRVRDLKLDREMKEMLVTLLFSSDLDSIELAYEMTKGFMNIT